MSPYGVRHIPNEIAAFLEKWKSLQPSRPSTLFHYTDAEGLRGIINSKCLWATNTNYVNDKQDCKYAQGMILRAFDDHINSNGNGRTLLKQLKEKYRAHSIIQSQITTPYVACFSERDDVLSQWRAYGSNGEGFSIGFSPLILEATLSLEQSVRRQVKFFKVIYSEPEQQDWINRAICALLCAFERNDEAEVFESMPVLFSEMTLCFKHRLFAEENEWRLVYVPQWQGNESTNNLIDVRVSDGRLILYAPLRIWDGGQELPFTSITHGPTTEAETTVLAIQHLLFSQFANWNSVVISGSQVPLRSR
jgi:hypothetical protein